MDLRRGLLSVDQLTREDVGAILDRAKFYKHRFRGKDKKVGGLNGMTMINMFFEPSTRTRISFEQAAKRMGMLVSNIIADASAMAKGESNVDTMRTLDAMHFDAVIMRTSQNNLPYELSRYTDAAIINAGDGTNEHPTQALLDLFTILESAPKAAKIVIVGNLVHSRVARSNTKLLLMMGYNVGLVAPTQWMPNNNDWGIAGYIDKGQCTISESLEQSVKDADVVMALRIQKERFSDIHRGLVDLKEYNQKYGIRRDTLTSKQILMHPGPVNRGVEIDEDWVYCPQSVILNQVENGVATRSAILEHILRD